MKKYIEHGDAESGPSWFDQFFDRFQQGDSLPSDWSPEKKEDTQTEIWAKIEQSIHRERQVERRPRRIGLYWTIAASVLIFVAAGVSVDWPKILKPPSQTIVPIAEEAHLQVLAGESVQAFPLADGSTVWLNSASTLTIAADFGDSLRMVSLEGEAFFEIARDSLHPFVVLSEGIYTQVLGTSFNISAYKTEDLKVSVSTGKVSVFQKNGPKEILSPGQGLKISAQDSSWKRQTIAQAQIASWREGILHFDNTKIKDVLPIFERRFGYAFELADRQTGNCALNGELSISSVTGFLLSLNSLYEIDYQSDNQSKTIYLSNGKCTR
ncbi:MAG: FecR domain-containing protein [Bacteroidota bacterium]